MMREKLLYSLSLFCHLILSQIPIYTTFSCLQEMKRQVKKQPCRLKRMKSSAELQKLRPLITIKSILKQEPMYNNMPIEWSFCPWTTQFEQVPYEFLPVSETHLHYQSPNLHTLHIITADTQVLTWILELPIECRQHLHLQAWNTGAKKIIHEICTPRWFKLFTICHDFWSWCED